MQLDQEYDRCSNHDVEIITSMLRYATKRSLDRLLEQNGLRLIDFAVPKYNLQYRYYLEIITTYGIANQLRFDKWSILSGNNRHQNLSRRSPSDGEIGQKPSIVNNVVSAVVIQATGSR